MNFNIRNTVGPLFLILVCPIFVMLFWYTNTQLEGSLLALWHLMLQEGFLQSIYSIWQPYFWGSAIAWKLILVFVV